MPLWLRPTGEFGIGIQSVFQITDKLKCETYSEQESPKEIIFRSKSSGGKISCQEIDAQFVTRLGSIFSFFISVKVFDRLKYSFGDRVDIGINTSDPFRMDEDMVKRYLYIFYLVECIKNDVCRDLFPIQIKAIIDGEHYEEELYPLEQYSCLKNANVLDENLLGQFDISSGQILAYDKKYAISFNLRLNFNQRKIIFTFKGMNVRFRYWEVFSRVRNFAFVGSIGLDGFSSKEYLTLNREKIREEKELELSTIIYKDIELLMIYYYSNIEKFKPEQKIQTEVWFSLASFYQMVRHKNLTLAEKCKESIIENLTSELPCYDVTHDECKTSLNKVSVFIDDIFSGKSFYVFESRAMEFSSHVTLSASKIHGIYQCSNISNEIKIYDKDIVEKFISLEESCLINVYDDNSENVDENSYIYEYRIEYDDENKNILLPTITDSLCKKLHKQILKHQRMFIMALKNYEIIAVKKLPDLIAWSYRRVVTWSTINYKNKYFIITPFIDNDIDSIKAGISKEKLWHQIEQRDDFLKLVNYVYENNIDKTKVTKDVIKNTYQKWINEIIDYIQSIGSDSL